jgi:hypothetical protein
MGIAALASGVNGTSQVPLTPRARADGAGKVTESDVT